ncbi:MAG TPA: hypothetical protein VEZ90_01935 [Blastocatellia bacterium]|nr:hypothetical protein [Blastocatellia bacterium]
MKIRPEQLEAFQPLADAAFARRLVAHIRDRHSNAVVKLPSGQQKVGQLSDDLMNIMAQAGIIRARTYGMTWESSISSFVVLMFLSAPNFDRHPLIERVLKDGQTDPNSRIENLWHRVSRQNWQAVESYYDANAWGLNMTGAY